MSKIFNDKSTVLWKMYRNVLLILLLLFLLVLPIGCSSTPSADKEEEFLINSAAPLTNTEHKTIKFYFPGTQPRNWPDVKEKIEKEINDTINVSLDFKWINLENYIQKTGTLNSAGEPFDAYCLAKPEKYHPDFAKLAREGKLNDITQLLNVNAPGLKMKYTEEELRFGQVDGKLYAVPSLYPHAYAAYLLADEALMKTLGISDISNYEQYEAYMKAVKENDPGLTPGIIANNIDTLQLFAKGAGYVIVDDPQKLVYKWDDPEMKVVAWEKTPEYKEAAYRIVDWFKKGYLAPNPDKSKVTSFIIYQDLQPASTTTLKLTFQKPSGKLMETNPLRTIYLYPDKQVQRDNPLGTFYTNGSIVFPSTSKNTDRVLQFLNWVQENDKNYFLMMYGIEGQDYVLDKESGYPALPEGMNFNNSSFVNWDGSWAFSNINYPAVSKEVNGIEAEEKNQFLLGNSKYAPHGALYPNYKSVEQVAESRSALFSKFETNLLQKGLTDTSEVDNFINQLEELGSDNLVEVAQKQLDEAVKARK
jgi:putative aldouronate transport system substrate-binding protein